MKNKCWYLFKVQLYNLFGINRLLHSRDKKARIKAVLAAVGALLIALLFAVYSAGLAYAYVYLRLTELLPVLLVLISAILTFVTTLLKGSGLLFGFRDYDMVMSLPVSTRAVMVSRLLGMYVFNLVFSVIALVPAGIVYGIASGAGLRSWIFLFFGLFLAPLLPMTIACLVSVLITAVSVRFRHKTLVSTVLSLAFIFLILIGSFSMENMSPQQLQNLGTFLSESVERLYPPAGWFSDAVSGSRPWSYLFFTAVSMAAPILFFVILAPFYGRLNTALASRHTKSSYQMGQLRTSSPFLALYRKELRRYLSCSIYLLNSSFGAFLYVAAGIALLFIQPEKLESLSGIPGFSGWLIALAPLFTGCFIGLSSTTCSAMSLEGKARWICGTIPVNPFTIYRAKIAVNLTILLPCSVIGSLFLTIGLKPGITDTLLLFVTPVMYSVFIAVVGMYINLKFPKYDWPSEYVAVKQGVSPLISMLAGLFSCLIPLGLSIVTGAAALVTLLTLVVLAAATLALLCLLKKTPLPL